MIVMGSKVIKITKTKTETKDYNHNQSINKYALTEIK